MSDPIVCDSFIANYDGPKKPPMTVEATYSVPLSEEIVEITEVSIQRAKELDFLFMKDIIHTPNTAEFNGYNTRLCRQAGMSLAPATTVKYMPLIDMTPSDL